VDFLHSETFPDPQTVEDSPNVRRVLLDLLETIVISLVLFLGINAVSERIRVESISMQPNLFAGDFVIVNKLAYKVGEPQRGDIIVFRYPPDPDQTPYIKRIIGLPGDQIHIAEGKVFINGKLLTEAYLEVGTNRGGDWSVPDNSLFVLGDNRNNSSDSRAWGMVPFDNVIGKAVVIYWPPENWRVLHFPAAVAAQP
jgi:signal peptidase I